MVYKIRVQSNIHCTESELLGFVFDNMGRTLLQEEMVQSLKPVGQMQVLEIVEN